MNENPYLGGLYTFLASFAGAITALSFRPFRDMTRTEIVLAIFVGASFAIFVGPWAIHAYYGAEAVDMRIIGAIFYIMATGSNALIPFVVRKISHVFDAVPKP